MGRFTMLSRTALNESYCDRSFLTAYNFIPLLVSYLDVIRRKYAGCSQDYHALVFQCTEHSGHYVKCVNNVYLYILCTVLHTIQYSPYKLKWFFSYQRG